MTVSTTLNMTASTTLNITTSPHHHIAISPHRNMEPKQIRTGKSVPCRSCKAAIFFLPTKNGKMMPIDAETVAVDDDVYMPGIHRSHFDTCPDAKKFSKK